MAKNLKRKTPLPGSIMVDGEEFLPPELVSDIISNKVGAHFSLKQVARLGDHGELSPHMLKGRRFYPRPDVEDFLKKDRVSVSRTKPGMARLRRADRNVPNPRRRSDARDTSERDQSVPKE